MVAAYAAGSWADSLPLLTPGVNGADPLEVAAVEAREALSAHEGWDTRGLRHTRADLNHLLSTTRGEVSDKAAFAEKLETAAAEHRLQLSYEQARLDNGGVTPPEIANTRVGDALASTGHEIGFAIGLCSSHDPALVLGCYRGGEASITVTELGLQTSNRQLRVIVSHEWRHWWQWTNSLWLYDDGRLTNKDELEADADEYSEPFGDTGGTAPTDVR